jgi:hypothetical protein
MGLYAKPPKVPDYEPLAKVQEALGQEQLTIMRDQLAQSKADTEWNRSIAEPAIKQSMEIQKREADFAAEQQKRYTDTFAPMEDAFAKEAAGFDTQARQDAEAGRALSEVGQAFDANTRNAQRELERYGIDPSMTRSASLNLQNSLERAKAQAQAGTDARRGIEDKGRALRAAAIDMGRGIPTQASNATKTALDAGTTAAGIGTNTSQSRVQGSQGALTWGQAGGNSLAGAVDTKDTGFQNQLDKYKTDQTVGPAAFAKDMLAAGLGIAAGKIPKVA